MANKLKAITTRAKKIYKKGKAGKTWHQAIREASKKIGSTTVSKKIKSFTRKAKVRLPHGYKTVKRKRVGTIAGHTSQLKGLIENKIANLLIKRDLKTKLKSEKRKINKQIAAYRRQWKNL